MNIVLHGLRAYPLMGCGARITIINLEDIKRNLDVVLNQRINGLSVPDSIIKLIEELDNNEIEIALLREKMKVYDRVNTANKRIIDAFRLGNI